MILLMILFFGFQVCEYTLMFDHKGKGMKAILTSAAIVGLGLFASFALTGCGGPPPAPPALPPPSVTVNIPVEKSVTDFVEITGRTAAVETVEVRARVWGYLNKVNFKEGALVKKDDVLFQIDPRTYKAALRQAEGNLAAMEARVKRLGSDFARAQHLLETRAMSREDYDKIVSDRGEATASLQALRAAVQQAELDLEFANVRAPIDGRVSRALVTQGNMVQSGQNGGTLLTTIVSVDPVYVYFDVDELTVLRIQQLMREGKAKSVRDLDAKLQVTLALANEQDFPHRGTVDFVDNQINSRTGTLRMRGVFGNQDESLAPGLFARVRVPVGDPHQALLVADRAIDSDQGQKIVYVLDKENKVGVRAIRVGAVHDGLRVIEDGIQRGERVVVNGLQQLRPGITVEPKGAEKPNPTLEARNSKESQISKLE
jgi:RND family efflux transporter MFP subunit